jgi:hypothetical protein
MMMLSRPTTAPGLVTALQPDWTRSPNIAPNFFNPVGIGPSGVLTLNLTRNKPKIGQFGSGPKIDPAAEDRISHIGKMSSLGIVEEDGVLDFRGVPDDAAPADKTVAAKIGTLPDFRLVADDGRILDQRPRTRSAHRRRSVSRSPIKDRSRHDHRGSDQLFIPCRKTCSPPRTTSPYLIEQSWPELNDPLV